LLGATGGQLYPLKIHSIFCDMRDMKKAGF